jgi:hypothetical protein
MRRRRLRERPGPFVVTRYPESKLGPTRSVRIVSRLQAAAINRAHPLFHGAEVDAAVRIAALPSVSDSSACRGFEARRCKSMVSGSHSQTGLQPLRQARPRTLRRVALDQPAHVVGHRNRNHICAREIQPMDRRTLDVDQYSAFSRMNRASPRPGSCRSPQPCARRTRCSLGWSPLEESIPAGGRLHRTPHTGRQRWNLLSCERTTLLEEAVMPTVAQAGANSAPDQADDRRANPTRALSIPATHSISCTRTCRRRASSPSAIAALDPAPVRN